MSSNRTIARNTLFLYARMFITMGVSLYTSRLILRQLGVEDFGVYNLVGGVIVLFSFMNSAMSLATQRFLNIEIASQILNNIRRVFSMSLNIHILISILVLILAESIGLWFLNHVLNIPKDRLFAANVVYQFSVFTSIVEILKVPYNSIVLAKERMGFFAIASVIETFVRLLAVIALSWFVFSDKLILYSFFILLLNFFSSTAFLIYCATQFKEEVRYTFEKDKALFQNLVSFSGWSLMGQVSVLSAGQGVNMILNFFMGVVVNAAMGIAGQVNGAIYSFVSNAQVAFNPQIVQSYADRDPKRHIFLVLQASRFSFFLLSVICIPFLVGTHFILELWLGEGYPYYSLEFTKIILLSSLISALAGPLWMSAYAVGVIRNYQICVSVINLVSLPVAYFLLFKGLHPATVLVAKFIIDACLMVYRIYYFKQTLKVSMSLIIDYLKSFLPVFILIATGTGILYVLKVNSISDWLFFSVAAEVIVFFYLWFWGISKKELESIIGLIKRKIKK